MKITELKGKAQVFTLKDGNTFRVLSHQSREIAESQISKEIKIAERMGLIMLTKNNVTSEVTEVTAKNKKGGTK